MRPAIVCLLLMALVSGPVRGDDAAPLAVAEVKRDTPVDFESEILPILRRNCLACHNAATHKADLVLETPATIAKGGASGAVVEPGDSDASMLMLVASHASEPFMPPAGNTVGAQDLTPEELGLVKLWISEGAKGEVKSAAAPPKWQPLPPGVHPILALAISPDGQYAACGRANQIFVYHVPTQRLVGRLTDPNLLAAKVYENAGVAHLDIVQSLAFSPDGRTLASGGYREVKIWRRPESPFIAELPGAGAAVALAASPDGRWTAVAGADGRVRLFAADNSAGPTLVGHAGPATAVAFLDAEAVLTAGRDGTLRRWRAADGALLATLDVGTPLGDAALLAEGQSVALACDDGLVRIVPPPTASPRDLLVGVTPSTLAVSPDGQRAAVVRPTGQIDVLSLADGALIKTLAGHDGGATAVAFLADSLRVATAGADHQLKVWETERGQATAQVALGDLAVTNLATLEADRLVLGTSAGGVATWTIGQDAPAPLCETPPEAGAVVGLATSPDRQTLYVARSAGSTAAIQLADGQAKYTIATGAAAASLSISPDGAWLAVGGGDGHVRLYNALDGQPSAPPALGPFAASVTSMAFTADSARIVIGTSAGEARLLLRSAGQTAQVLAAADGRPALVAIAGENALVAAGNRLTAFPLGVAQILAGHAQAVTRVAIVPGQPNQLASGGADGTVRVWDLTSGAVSRQLDAGGPVTALAVRGDALRIAAAAETGLVRVWNAADGAQVAELKGDVRANARVARLTTYVNLAKNGSDAADKALAEARKALEDTAAAASTATAALPPVQQTAAETEAAAKNAAAAKDAAAKLVADAEALVKTTTEAKTAAETASSQAATLAASTGEAAQQSTAASEGATEVQSAAAAALEKLKAAAAAAPADEALKSAVAAAEKSAAEAAALAASTKAAMDGAAQVAATHRAAAETAAAALQDAQTNLDAATAALQAEKDKLAAADKAATEAAAAAKSAADALADATRKAADADAAAARAKVALPTAEAQAALLKTTYDQTQAQLVAAQEAARAAELPVRVLRYSPDGRMLGAAGDAGGVQLLDGESASGVAAFPAAVGPVHALSFFGAETLVAAGAQGTRRLGVEPAWTLERVVGPPAEAPLAVEHSLLADRVGALAFSPDGAWLATGGGEPSRTGELKLWSVADGALVHDFVDAHSDTVFGVDFSWDGRWLASCGADKFVKVWDTLERRGVRAYEGHTHHVLGVAWRWDGQVLASCGADGAIKLWGFESGEQIRTAGGYAKQLTGLRFIADSVELVTSGADAAVHLINTDNGKGVRNFGGASDFLYCVAVTPDGRLVAAGGADGVLRVWTAADAKSVATFGPPEDEKPASK